MIDLQERFGLLRELVQRPNLNSQSEQLGALIDAAHIEHPEQYQSIWMPYLRDHLKSMRWAPCICPDLETLSHEHQRQRWPWLALALEAPRTQTLEALIEHPACAQITHLALNMAMLDDDAILSLLSPRTFPALYSLELIHNKLKGETLTRVIEALSPRLRWLDLSSNPITERHLLTLAQGTTLSSLYGLGLNNLSLGPNSLRALLSKPRQWRSLNLACNAFGDKGAAFIARATTLNELVNLNLHTCQLSERGLKLMADSGLLARLRELNLSLNPLGASWATCLLGQGRPLALRALRFGSHQQLTGEAWLASQVEGAIVPHLRVLCSRISSADTHERALATQHMIRSWPSLEVIDLGYEQSLIRPDLNPFAATLDARDIESWRTQELDATYCFACAEIRSYDRRAVDYFYHDELW